MDKLSAKSYLKILEALLDGSRVSALVTNPELPDNPIIYANKTFETMTGYKLNEIIGKNCRFLQGEDTDQNELEKIRNGIRNRIPVTAILKNYRKDGNVFWNRVAIKPLEVEDRLFFTATQTDVSIQQNQQILLEDKDFEIEQLMFPILRVQHNIAAVSLIGSMTSDRFNFLTQKLTEYVQQEDVDNVIVDITGLHWSNDSVSISLFSIQDVLALMGRKLYVTGISPKWAKYFAQTSESTQQLHTFTSIQQAIEHIQ